MVVDSNAGSDFYTVGKVAVDLQFYKGNGQYSDGDVENELLEALRNGTADELLRTDNRWPILYHLSPVRHHLLDGLNFKEGSSVLEIGCGCGGISGVLCQKAGSVEAVEISPRRAEIAAYRNKEYDNLTIHVGNLNDMDFEKKFDYVTLIGVLEYAGSFTHADNPWASFLKNCRKFLNPTGTLIIAIENRLGMKYWSGAAEDHTGNIFDGITGYRGIKRVKTFSRRELANLLQSVGLTQIQWFYPYPDYKMPVDIYSDRFLPRAEDIREVKNISYDVDRLELFSEKEAFVTMLEAELYPEFANSFLVLCQEEGQKVGNVITQPDYVHHAQYRADDMRTGTAVMESDGRKVIRKFALNKASEKHIRNIVENCRILSGIYGAEHVAQCRLIEPGVLEMEYVPGETLLALTINALEESGTELFVEYLDFYCKHILKGGEDTEEFSVDTFDSENRRYDFDLHLGNVIIRDNTFIIVDYEWLAEELPVKYLLYRTLNLIYDKYLQQLAARDVNAEDLLNIAGISAGEAETFAGWENQFYSRVLDLYEIGYEKQRIPVNFKAT